MQPVHSDGARAIVILLSVIALLATLPLFLRYARLRAPQAILAWIVSLVVAGGAAMYRHEKLDELRRAGLSGLAGSPGDRAIMAVCTGVFILLTSAFAIRLYRKWLDGDLTESERASGTIGLRAWLSPANLFMAALISLAAWQGLGWPILLVLVVTGGALLAWPALHATKAAPPALMQMPGDSARAQDSSREREKVLSLLESGKISAEESSELLQALAASAPLAGLQPVPAGSRSALALAGAALVLIGFFLPWFSFSPSEKMASMLQEIHGSMAAPMLEMSKSMPMQSVRVRGGDIANGLGWIVLVLALTSALLPHLAPNLERASLRTFRILTLAGGGIILLYLLSQDPSSISIGLILALIGYGCAGVALWREEHAPVLTPRSAEAQV
jgi:hypothetical protein